MENKEGYKNTEIGWIPEDWEVVNTNQIAMIKGGNGFPEKYQGDANGNIPFIKVSDMNLYGNNKYIIKSNNYVKKSVIDKLKLTIFEPNSIVFAKVGAALLLNRRRILSQPTIIDNNMMGITPNTNIDIEFLYQLFIEVDFSKFVQTGAVPSVNQKMVGEIALPLPPIPEQQKIASILTTVDDKISSIQAQIQQTEQLKKGLMAKLLTEGIGHTEFKDTEIGRIPKAWEVVQCDNVCIKITDGEHLTPNFTASGIPLVSAKDVENIGVNFNNVKYISESDYFAISKKCEPQYGDILIVSRGATIGRTTYNSSRLQFGLMGSVILLKPHNDKIIGVFLSQYLKTSLNSNNVLKLSGSSAQQAIYLKDIKKAMLPLPPLSEQQQIASILSSVDDKLDVLQSKKTSYSTLKKGLMAKLLTGQMRVKI